MQPVLAEKGVERLPHGHRTAEDRSGPRPIDVVAGSACRRLEHHHNVTHADARDGIMHVMRGLKSLKLDDAGALRQRADDGQDIRDVGVNLDIVFQDQGVVGIRCQEGLQRPDMAQVTGDLAGDQIAADFRPEHCGAGLLGPMVAGHVPEQAAKTGRGDRTHLFLGHIGRVKRGDALMRHRKRPQLALHRRKSIRMRDRG